MTHLIDRYLIFRIRTKRDPEAFARIYDRYIEAIYRFAAFKLPSAEEAQDVTAETFTKTWQYLHETKEVTNIRALLYRIARNLIADYYRTAQNQPQRLSVHDGVTSESGVTFSGEIPSHVVEGAYSDQDAGKRLLEARADFALVLQKLERLKEDYRDVLLLRLVDDLPFSVIADILEKKTGHVRVIYHRALKTLKELENF